MCPQLLDFLDDFFIGPHSTLCNGECHWNQENQELQQSNIFKSDNSVKINTIIDAF